MNRRTSGQTGVGRVCFEDTFAQILGDLPYRARVPQMEGYVQHGSVSTLTHAISVAKTALRLAWAFRMEVSEAELVRGAMLHDYYLYDWHEPNHARHATKHPLRALANAERDFDLSAKEANIIAAHMWPLPPTRVPASREAWLVCASDKWCSLVETLFMRS